MIVSKLLKPTYLSFVSYKMSGRSSRSRRRQSRERQSSGGSRKNRRDNSDDRNTPPIAAHRRLNSPIDRRDRSSRHRSVSHSPHRRPRSRRNRENSYDNRDNSHNDALDRILTRLEVIERRLPTASSSGSPLQPTSESRLLSSLPVVPIAASDPGSGVTETITDEVTVRNNPRATDVHNQDKDVANNIVDALSALLKTKSHNFYISSFDPSVQDFDVWCTEVDRGRLINNWDDRECLGRIGSCLRGDARSWLNDWVTNDRSWSNFKVEFRSLCPRNVDCASILYEVMCSNSNKYPTYAEYARKSLLRLNIVRGLSDELKSAIVVRGISDPQVKAAATNAKLACKDLVEFLSVYVKPKNDNNTARDRASSNNSSNQRKREIPKSGNSHTTCHICGKTGHKKWYCPKKFKNANSVQDPSTSNSAPPTSSDKTNKPVQHCTFCKRNGHSIDSCFQKQRSQSNKKMNEVNFCSESTPDKIT